MICPTCSAAGQRSTVRVIRSTNPGQPKDHFWDEEGVEHFHNPNIIVTELECSSGHRFAERSSWQCHECGYKACDAQLLIDGQPVAAALPNP